jgi:hypothetical protein
VHDRHDPDRRGVVTAEPLLPVVTQGGVVAGWITARRSTRCSGAPGSGRRGVTFPRPMELEDHLRAENGRLSGQVAQLLRQWHTR